MQAGALPGNCWCAAGSQSQGSGKENQARAELPLLTWQSSTGGIAALEKFKQLNLLVKDTGREKSNFRKEKCSERDVRRKAAVGRWGSRQGHLVTSDMETWSSRYGDPQLDRVML